MGSKKYPDENDYRAFIANHEEFSNATTYTDKTIYYFEISNDAFEGALDRFAQFFICPIFNESCIEREIKAIDNEFSNLLNNDAKRFYSLKYNEINKESPFNNFDAGNSKTLSLPDIRDRLLVFYKKYYTSEIMNLSVYSNKTLDESLKLVESLFTLVPKIKNFQMPRYDEVKPYDENNLRFFYKIVPIKDINEIRLDWYLPYCDDYYSKPFQYLSSVLGHQGPNTIYSSLSKDNLIYGISARSEEMSKSYTNFSINVVLSKKGIDNYKEVILRILKYIKIIQNKGVNKRYYEEVKRICQINFDYMEKLAPSGATQSYMYSLINYNPEDIIA